MKTSTKIFLSVGLFLSVGIFPNLIFPQVKPGLEILITKQLNLIEGKRVGLITNPTGVTAD